MKKNNLLNTLREYWILLFIVLQPLLDVLAYWTQNDAGTASGYIRLVLMVVLYVFAFCKKRSPAFLAASALIALTFGLHILNGLRLGSISLSADLKAVARVAYMPVMAVSFAALVDDENKQKQILYGIFLSAAVTGVVIILSVITDTYMPTYILENLGISGWVTDSNRCCHSDIMACFAIFAAYGAFLTKKTWLKFLLPPIIMVAMITNATSTCYLTLLAVLAGFPVFCLFRSLLLKKKIDRLTRILLAEFALLFAFSIAIYPYTPRHKMEELKHAFYSDNEQQFVQEMSDLGYDIYAMSLEEKMSDPVVHEKLTVYYNRFICNTVMSMRDRFGIDRVITALDGTVSAAILDDGRIMKRLNAHFIMEDSDFLTHLTGYEFGNIRNAYEDLENDWHAMYYYYGYIGIGSYILVIAYLAWRILKLLIRSFGESLTLLNFTLLLSFVILLGLAGFSGALFRRPNASIYLALVIAMIWHQTSYKANNSFYNLPLMGKGDRTKCGG